MAAQVRVEVVVTLIVVGLALIALGVVFLAGDRWRARAETRRRRPVRVGETAWRPRRTAVAPGLFVAGAGALVGAAIAGATQTAGAAQLVAVIVAALLIVAGVLARSRSRRATTPPGDYEYEYD
jgi:uncharacterized membrane protein